MASISWNDLNDSSELSAASSDEAPTKPNDERQKNAQPTTLQKTLSSPQPAIKSHKFAESDRIAENLQKLQKHNGQTVWLYVIQNSNRPQQSEKILNDLNIFQKVNAIGKGLNVLIKVDLAAKYIEKGYQQNGANFRFIYSNKNQPRNQGGKKMHKKYSQKHQQSRYDDFDDLKSPKIKSKNTFNQRTTSMKETEKAQKKKVKYVLKDPLQKKQEFLPKSLEEIQQNSQPSNKQVSRTESKQQKISIDSEANKKQNKIQQTIKEKTEQKNQQQVKNKENDAEEEQQKQTQKTKFKKKESELSDDDEGENEKQVKQKNKKNKKKKKGKSGAGTGSGSVDPNNRFSGLF